MRVGHLARTSAESVCQDILISIKHRHNIHPQARFGLCTAREEAGNSLSLNIHIAGLSMGYDRCWAWTIYMRMVLD